MSTVQVVFLVYIVVWSAKLCSFIYESENMLVEKLTMQTRSFSLSNKFRFLMLIQAVALPRLASSFPSSSKNSTLHSGF